MDVITLGTAGGPAWWPEGEAGPRLGISTAVRLGERWYLVDFGMGAARQMRRAGMQQDQLRAGFITHLHSDHVSDLANFFLFGLYDFQRPPQERIPLFGPGNRGQTTPVSPAAGQSTPPVLYPEKPTPGTEELVDLLWRAYASDLNERVLDSLRVSPADIWQPRDIDLSAVLADPTPQAAPPEMRPFTVFEDDRVRVSATLVQHPPVWPAFAYRFESGEGSVVISGDTAPCANLLRLATGADLLLHEAIDPAHIERLYGGRTDPLSVASREHHFKAHTFPEDAGRLAEQAGVKTLALHHLVPGHAPESAWRAAEKTFNGPVLIPRDLQTIPVG